MAGVSPIGGLLGQLLGVLGSLGTSGGSGSAQPGGFSYTPPSAGLNAQGLLPGGMTPPIGYGSTPSSASAGNAGMGNLGSLLAMILGSGLLGGIGNAFGGGGSGVSGFGGAAPQLASAGTPPNTATSGTGTALGNLLGAQTTQTAYTPPPTPSFAQPSYTIPGTSWGYAANLGSQGAFAADPNTPGGSWEYDTQPGATAPYFYSIQGANAVGGATPQQAQANFYSQNPQLR